MRQFLCLLSFLIASPLLAQSPSISNITFDGISHSTVRATFAASGPFYWLRTRYIAAPGSCANGTSGSLQGSSYSNLNFGALHPGPGNTVVVGGLLPNTTYQICPEISNDFSNWSSGIGASVTTLPMPSTHPVAPLSPATFNTDYPSTAAYTSVTASGDCSNLMNLINTAIDNQATNGTVINIPAGAVCTGPFNISKKASDLVQFNSGSVDTNANIIAVSNHGLSEGQKIVFGSSYGCLPGSLTNLNGDCHKNGQIISGQAYYAHVVSSGSFQVFSGSPSGSGGSLIPLTDGGNGSEYFVRLPRPLNWIIIRTSTPDVMFTPEHVRTTPAWLSKMATLQAPSNAMAGPLPSNTLLSVGDFDNNNMSMLANIRFVGLQFTYSRNNLAYTSSDPQPWFTLFATYETDQNIIADRCYFHGLGTPNRVYNAVFWDGMNVAIVDSYLDNFEYFHSMYSGLSLTKVN